MWTAFFFLHHTTTEEGTAGGHRRAVQSEQRLALNLGGVEGSGSDHE